MARRRMLDPNILQSEDYAELSLLSRALFIGMILLADDYGKGRAKPVYLKSMIFPYDDKIRLIDVEKALSEEIIPNMSVTFYAHNGNDYYKLNSWKKWQRVDKPQPSIIPDPGEIDNNSDVVPESVGNHSGIIPESVGNDSCLKEKKGNKEKYSPPNPLTGESGEGEDLLILTDKPDYSAELKELSDFYMRINNGASMNGSYGEDCRMRLEAGFDLLLIKEMLMLSKGKAFPYYRKVMQNRMAEGIMTYQQYCENNKTLLDISEQNSTGIPEPETKKGFDF